jgi:hypothetical protein
MAIWTKNRVKGVLKSCRLKAKTLSRGSSTKKAVQEEAELEKAELEKNS